METLIRETKSVCPVCLRIIRARIVEEDSLVYMKKDCIEHGNFKLLVCRHPDYYKELNGFYFSVMDKSFLQRDYIVHLTNKCDLDCPICLADSNSRHTEEYSLNDLKQFLKGKKGFKIDLMGAEPTIRQDLPEIIKSIKQSGNIAALHTNGIRITDFYYLEDLKEAGLSEVHLQFDGFDDSVYEKIRGRRQLEIKLKALDNLKKLNIATDLVATIVRGINEKEMIKILNFGVENGFVKEIFFLGCRFLGKAKNLLIENCMMPDELIDILQEQTNNKISRENILKFQKLYFSLLSAVSMRKCFYNQHFLIGRNKNEYIPVDKLFDLEGIQNNLDKFKKLKISGSILASPYFFLSLFFKLVGFKSLFWIKEFLAFGPPFIWGFDLSRLPRKSLLLGFITACDAYSLDYDIAKNCGKGAISVELGIQDTGAIDNVLRDSL